MKWIGGLLVVLGVQVMSSGGVGASLIWTCTLGAAIAIVGLGMIGGSN